MLHFIHYLMHTLKLNEILYFIIFPPNSTYWITGSTFCSYGFLMLYAWVCRFFYFFWVALFATSLCSLFSNDWIAQVWLWALAVSGTFTNSVLHFLFEILFNSSFHTVHVKICWCESFILSFVQYHANCCVSEHAEPCYAKNAIKKRKLCSEASGSLEEAVTNGNSSSVSESIG